MLSRRWNFELKTTTLCCRTSSNYSEYSDTTVCRLEEARFEHVWVHWVHVWDLTYGILRYYQQQSILELRNLLLQQSSELSIEVAETLKLEFQI